MAANLVPNLKCVTQSRTGLFTQCLLEHLTTPDLDIRKLFDRVNQAVFDRSNGKQEPVRAQWSNPKICTFPLFTMRMGMFFLLLLSHGFVVERLLTAVRELFFFQEILYVPVIAGTANSAL